MKEYNLIKNVIKNAVYGDYNQVDKSTHASLVSEDIDDMFNDYARHMNYDIIACIAYKEGYTVIRVNYGYYGEPDYIILDKNYTLDEYRRKWAQEMDDIDEVLDGAHKILSLDQILCQD